MNSIVTDLQKLEGLLIVNKEEGLSSYDVIRRIKSVVFEKFSLTGKDRNKFKIGHSGTLDPFASGVLIIMLGRATKLNDILHLMDKVYEVEAEFGYETDSQDPTGIKVREAVIPAPTKAELKKHMESLTGELMQTPPSYSATKVDGRPAYLSARKGNLLKLKQKVVEVRSWDLLELNWPVIRCRVEVGTGTYIRTLIVDLAKAMGGAATATSLHRASIGGFVDNDALGTKDIDCDSIVEKLISIKDGLDIVKKSVGEDAIPEKMYRLGIDQ